MGRDTAVLFTRGKLDEGALVAVAREVLGAKFEHELLACLAFRELRAKKSDPGVPVTALSFRSAADSEALPLPQLAAALSQKLGPLLFAYCSDHGGASGWGIVEKGFLEIGGGSDEESDTAIKPGAFKRAFGVAAKGLDVEELTDHATRALRLGPSARAGEAVGDLAKALEVRDVFFTPPEKVLPPSAFQLLHGVLIAPAKGIAGLRPFLSSREVEVVFDGTRATTIDAALALLAERLPREQLHIYEEIGSETRRRHSKVEGTDTCKAPVSAHSKPWKVLWDVTVVSKDGVIEKLVFAPR